MTHLREEMRLWIMFQMGFHEINGLFIAITVLKKKLRRLRLDKILDEHNFILQPIGNHMLMTRQKRYKKSDQVLSQSTIDESEFSPNDDVGKMLGKEHSGRVRCLGLGVVPNRAFKHTRPRFGVMNGSSYNNGSCSSVCQDKYKQVLDAHNEIKENYAQIVNARTQMMNDFKAYMIMKERRIREEFAGIFVPPPGTTANDRTRRLFDGTDSSDNN